MLRGLFSHQRTRFHGRSRCVGASALGSATTAGSATSLLVVVPSVVHSRRFASAAFLEAVKNVRNFGISAHIDSGKTTCSERILFYTGRIKAMHEVKGGGDVGATMDSMELERERGITIRSAATFCKWKHLHFNLIDTPGHVDFTIEVERSLRCLDGAVLLLCAVGGIQSQTVTVDRQMRRYSVPRIAFINKMDRDNANPQKVLEGLKTRLNLKCAFLQLNMGTAHDFEGVVDIIEGKAMYFDGPHGEIIRAQAIPDYLQKDAEAARQDLVACLADCDSVMEEAFLSERVPTAEEIHDAIRRATMANKFVPVMMGSAYKNKGVQLLLDAVGRYLPSPLDRVNTANLMEKEVVQSEDDSGNTQPETVWKQKSVVDLAVDDEKPLVAMIFKLEETPSLGLCNYVRVYQGKLRKSDTVINIRSGKTFSPPKLVRMSANAAVGIDEIKAGEICAIVGEIDASSGDSIIRQLPGKPIEYLACENMYVPPRVLSLAVKAKDDVQEREAVKRLQHFMREDPTFVMKRNSENKEIILEGMGELHIDIYVERLKREHNLELTVGKPTVNYREIIQAGSPFDYLYKRQSGGAGQWAHIKGAIEVLPIDMSSDQGQKNRVVLKCPNGEVRENLQKSVQKQMELKIFPKGQIMDCPLWGVKVTLSSGAMHEVDSNDIAFRNCTQEMWNFMLPKLQPAIVEPCMSVEIRVPSQYMSDVASEFTRREGVVMDQRVDGPDCVLVGESTLDAMFGFVVDLRKLTKGQGEFSMEFKEYRVMPSHRAQGIIDEKNKQMGRRTFDLSSGRAD